MIELETNWKQRAIPTTSNISKEDLAAIKKALKHVSDANALLSNLISK